MQIADEMGRRLVGKSIVQQQHLGLRGSHHGQQALGRSDIPITTMPGSLSSSSSSANLRVLSALAMNIRTVHVLSPFAKNGRIHADCLVSAGRATVELIEAGSIQGLECLRLVSRKAPRAHRLHRSFSDGPIGLSLAGRSARRGERSVTDTSRTGADVSLAEFNPQRHQDTKRHKESMPFVTLVTSCHGGYGRCGCG